MKQLTLTGEVPEISIFTIGYGRRPLKEFRKALSSHSIEEIIDVRSDPETEYYGKEFMSQNFNYISLPMLGGLHHRKAQYPAWKEQKGVKSGLLEIIEHSRTHKIAIMCAEIDHKNCHRFYFVSRGLKEMGEEVQHL